MKEIPRFSCIALVVYSLLEVAGAGACGLLDPIAGQNKLILTPILNMFCLSSGNHWCTLRVDLGMTYNVAVKCKQLL